MNREIHVRFWEGLGVRFPRATHLLQYELLRRVAMVRPMPARNFE